MNILITAPHGLYLDYSASFVHNQAKAYVQAGHRVRAVIPIAAGKMNDAGKRFGKIVDFRCVDGVEICYVRHLSLGKFGAGWFNRKSSEATFRLFIRKILKGFVPDAVHGHTLDFGSEVGGYLKKQLGCLLVVTTHGGDTNVPLKKGQYELLKKYCEPVDAVVAVSSKLKTGLESCGVTAPIYVIYNGFLEHPVPVPCEKDPAAIIQVGNLVPTKHFDVTIRALAALRQAGFDMTLTIIGQGPLRCDLENLCDQLGIADAVHFLGRRPNSEVFQKMCEATYFVMASKPEGFGIVYLEAMAAGCVTVGTAGEGIADVIIDGENGFLVPADNVDAVVDVLRMCIRDSQRTAEIAHKGQQTAEIMTWSNNVYHYQSLFENLIRGINE